jgi:4-hydroxybenzoate polyprenyltransferase
MPTTMTKQVPPSGQAEEKDEFNFFPHLPPYSAPTSGFVSKLPQAWIPYAQLMRLDRPAGLYAFYFPYLIGLAYAACVSPQTPDPLTVLKLGVVLLPFNILMRGAACTWNDTTDQAFDRRVERCRHRPIARGAVSTTQANAFTLAQLAVGYPLLRFFLPPQSTPHILVTVLLFCIYALLKRVTYYPQVELGVAFAWAIFSSVAVLGGDPFDEHARAPTLALFGANILWTIIYDTIYAHQDIADDEKAGVKGMALKFRDSTKGLSSALTVILLTLLTLCGVWAGFSPVYFVGTVGGVAASMSYYIWDVELKEPQSCGAWFHAQFWLVGGGFVSGFMGEYMIRLL